MAQCSAWVVLEQEIDIPLARQHRWPYLMSKRLVDVVGSGILLILLSPLFLVLAVLIMLDSPGPSIFRQKRVGLRRRTQNLRTVWEVCPFTFYKFRTMYQNADSEMHRAYIQAFIHNDQQGMAELQNGDTEVRKLVDDPRITPLGRFLRKSSLDELPQLWNVFKGDMSLVGPRPPIPYEVEMYEPKHYRRLGTKPGITGLWQVTARSSADFYEMVSLDVEYIEHQSLWLDLKILLQTPMVVLRGKGAV
jgi:lipopolysaccharide/colanic/teichoic acid biosynthesis glycosyltransferase